MLTPHYLSFHVKQIWGSMDLLFRKDCHLLSDFSSKFQSSVTIFHPLTNICSLRSSIGLHPSVIGTCRLKILYWARGSLRACVHGPAHSSGPLKCGWIVACVLLHAETSDPLLSIIWWPSGLHGNSP